MPQKYKCEICDSKPDQLSHHKMHIDTQKHKDKRTIFELKLKSMTNEALEEKYKTNNINEIINKIETKKIITFMIKEKTEMDSKKTISGNTIWNLETNQDTNQKYASIKSKLDSIIKRCHDLLYSKGGSIVGTKAQNDIMKILCLKILQSQFNDENSELWDRCNIIKTETNMSDTQFIRFKTYCNDITEITKKDDVFKEWRVFVNKFLSKVFPSIYYENDNKFNCDNSQCIIEVIKIIDSLDIDDEFKDAFSTTCGDIHELFRAYGGRNSGAKALGQFFTPRHLIHLMFHGIRLDKLMEPIEDITIYDPCMGTGGFLTRLFKMCNISSQNIYGCETEIDTIKFGEMSMVLTTGNSRNNIIKCDSLCENEFILNKKFSCIVTNPPFGTSMKYKDLKTTFETQFPNSPVKFKDIYPLNTNNGACLFVQHCVYMLAEGGFCAIVLPDGELFEGNSKWSKNFRKWLSEKVNIRIILKVASGTFEHAGVKTNVVVFTKDGPTQNIQFMETPKECNVVKDMFTISAEELKSAGYSLDVGEYLVEETYNYDVPMVALGEVCDMLPTTKHYSSIGNKNGAFKFYVSSQECNLYLDTFEVEQKSIIIGNGGQANIHIDSKFTPSKHVTVCQLKTYKLNIEYCYLYLKYNIHLLNNKFSGSGLKWINKEKISKIKIPLLSLEVQQQIVDELSHIETSIETIESRIAQLKREKDQYKKYGRKAEIRELLKNSVEKMLGEVCEFKGYKYIKRLDMIEGEYKVIGGGKKPSGFHNKFNKDANTILCSGTGSYAGYISKYSTPVWASESFSIHSNDNQKLNESYLYLYLKNIQEFLYTKRPASGGQPHMYPKTMSKIKIPIPSQEIQKQCITLFEEKEKFIQSIDEKIDNEKAYIEELKQMAKDVISSFC